MITLTKKELEKKIGLRVKDNVISLGVDPASKTGWCIIDVENDKVTIDYGTITVDSNDVYFKYNQLIKLFENLFENISKSKKEKIAIIEDCWLGHNVAALKMLARIGMIVYTISYQKNVPRCFITPVQSRKKLGFKGNSKKSIFQQEAIKKYRFQISDPDAFDGIVLALNGILKDLL